MISSCFLGYNTYVMDRVGLSLGPAEAEGGDPGEERRRAREGRWGRIVSGLVIRVVVVVIRAGVVGAEVEGGDPGEEGGGPQELRVAA